MKRLLLLLVTCACFGPPKNILVNPGEFVIRVSTVTKSDFIAAGFSESNAENMMARIGEEKKKTGRQKPFLVFKRVEIQKGADAPLPRNFDEYAAQLPSLKKELGRE